MDPRRVLTFRAVAHERSFSRAARALSLTQPAVSQQVAALEKEIGSKLLAREPGGLKLTPAGTVLLEHADAIALRFELAATQLAELARGERVRLRIGAFSSSLAGLVPELIERLRGESPDVEVLVEEGGSSELAAKVLAGDLHMSLAFQDATDPRREHAGLERRDVMREAFLVALPEEHALAGRAAVRLDELADEPWSAASTDGLIFDACRRAGFAPRIVSITRDPIAIRELVARGLAVTLAPPLLTRGLAGVALVPIAGDPPERDIYVLLPPAGRHPLAERAFAALAEVASGLQ